jgi:tyrosyl-tRNA synthetase
MDVEERLRLIREVATEGEIVTEEELRALLAEKAHPIAYDGFEPSGTIHIAQGVLRAINVNKMTRAGVRFKMFVADWHAWANNKMGGDLEKIQTTGKYLMEIWRATGMDLENVEFVWASEFVTDESYWKKVMNIARDSSLDRILRTTQIMGRSDKDKLSAAQILYPCMQAADIFHLKADITQLGMDQRKVNMLAREVGPKLGFWKPVVVSHHMLMGLQQPPAALPDRRAFEEQIIREIRAQFSQLTWGWPGGEHLSEIEPLKTELVEALAGPVTMKAAAVALGRVERESKAFILPQLNVGTPEEKAQTGLADYEALWALIGASQQQLEGASRQWEQMFIERATAMKMSKSNPDTAIFMTDDVKAVEKKLNKAYCPERIVDENPVLEYNRYIVFERFPEVTVERPEKFGGTVTFTSYAELEAAFVKGDLHPADLKKTTARYVNQLLQPVRDHFEKDEKARALKEQVESFKVTR